MPRADRIGPAESIPCRACGAEAGRGCRTANGRPSPVPHSTRKADLAALGREPGSTADALGRHLIALRYAAADKMINRGDAGWGRCWRSKQAVSPTTIAEFLLVGAIEHVAGGWRVTDFGLRVVEARGAA